MTDSAVSGSAASDPAASDPAATGSAVSETRWTDPPALAIEGLSLRFGTAPVLDGVSLSIRRGEVLGLVGESGSGKSVTALATLGLLDRSARVTAGRIRLEDEDILGLSERRLRAIRGRRIATVFQHPRRALNPTRPVGRQIVDVLRAHGSLGRRDAKREAVEALGRVGIPDPGVRFGSYPFELSGGQCQRVTLALALAARPSVLIADEPTTGLDVTTQVVVLDLVTALVRERGLAMLFITHDLALAAQRCDRIAVMHAGQVVETGPAEALVRQPSHPSTQGLVAATPRPGLHIADAVPIPGAVPDLGRPDLPACRFFGRCTSAIARCATEAPPAVAVGPGHQSRCWALGS